MFPHHRRQTQCQNHAYGAGNKGVRRRQELLHQQRRESIESKASFFVDVPIVSGKFSKTFTPRQVLPVTRFIENDPVLSKLVRGWWKPPTQTTSFSCPASTAMSSTLATPTGEEKRRALITVYRKVMPYKGWEEYDTISVKFKGQK